MFAGLCTKAQLTPPEAESEYSSSTSSTILQTSITDSAPLVLPSPGKSLNESENLSLLSHLRRLVLGSSTFQFRRFQDTEVEEDARTVVTYISLGASTPRQQRQIASRSNEANGEASAVIPRCLVNRAQRRKSPKKRHVSWKDLETEPSTRMVWYFTTKYPNALPIKMRLNALKWLRI